MYPILDLGLVELRSFGVMSVLCMLLSLLVGEVRGRRRGLEPGTMVGFCAFIYAGGWLGAKLVPMFVEPAHVFSSWEGFVRGFVFTAGAWYGGLLGGVLGLVLASRNRKVPVRVALDIVTPALLLGIALGRMGCLLAGCDHGRPAEGVAWAIIYSDPRGLVPAGLLGVPLHPVQVYDALCSMSILAVVLLIERTRLVREGGLFVVFLALYGSLRLFTETYRGDAIRGLWLGGRVSTSQILSVVLLAGVAVLLAARRRATSVGS